MLYVPPIEFFLQIFSLIWNRQLLENQRSKIGNVLSGIVVVYGQHSRHGVSCTLNQGLFILMICSPLNVGIQWPGSHLLYICAVRLVTDIPLHTMGEPLIIGSCPQGWLWIPLLFVLQNTCRKPLRTLGPINFPLIPLQLIGCFVGGIWIFFASRLAMCEALPVTQICIVV